MIKYAVVKDGEIVKSGLLGELFPNTSFPVSGPNEQFMKEHDLTKIETSVEHNSSTHKQIPCEPYVQDGKVFAVTTKKFTKAETDKNAKAMERFNGLRGKK